MSTTIEQYRGQDSTLESIRTKAKCIHNAGALSGGESWQEACDVMYRQMTNEGLKSTALEVEKLRISESPKTKEDY